MDITEGNPDDFDAALADAGIGEPQEQAQTAQSPETANLPDAFKPSNQGAPQGQQLLAGKYKTPAELEKAHKSLYGEFSKRSQKLNTLESIIKNPEFHKWAANDPQMRDALAKAGYEIAREREQEEVEEGGEWNGDVNEPSYQVALLRAELELEKQESQLTKQIGRELTPVERRDIYKLVETINGISVSQAWRLTPHYDAMVKAQQDKAIASARGAGSNRPRPPAGLASGQKIDLKKPVTNMNEAERREYISSIMEGGNK